jgi:hypothetical protein
MLTLYFSRDNDVTIEEIQNDLDELVHYLVPAPR